MIETEVEKNEQTDIHSMETAGVVLSLIPH